jgi:hypothetical protein
MRMVTMTAPPGTATRKKSEKKAVKSAPYRGTCGSGWVGGCGAAAWLG